MAKLNGKKYPPSYWHTSGPVRWKLYVRWQMMIIKKRKIAQKEAAAWKN